MSATWVQPVFREEDSSHYGVFIPLDVLQRPAWHKQANCRNEHPSYFFRQYSRGIPEWIANLCNSCSVSQECSDQGRSEKWGIWAGAMANGIDRPHRLD